MKQIAKNALILLLLISKTSYGMQEDPFPDKKKIDCLNPAILFCISSSFFCTSFLGGCIGCTLLQNKDYKSCSREFTITYKEDVKGSSVDDLFDNFFKMLSVLNRGTKSSVCPKLKKN